MNTHKILKTIGHISWISMDILWVKNLPIVAITVGIVSLLIYLFDILHLSLDKEKRDKIYGCFVNAAWVHFNIIWLLNEFTFYGLDWYLNASIILAITSIIIHLVKQFKYKEWT